jgi:hypothetical protein
MILAINLLNINKNLSFSNLSNSSFFLHNFKLNNMEKMGEGGACVFFVKNILTCNMFDDSYALTDGTSISLCP